MCFEIFLKLHNLGHPNESRGYSGANLAFENCLLRGFIETKTQWLFKTLKVSTEIPRYFKINKSLPNTYGVSLQTTAQNHWPRTFLVQVFFRRQNRWFCPSTILEFKIGVANFFQSLVQWKFWPKFLSCYILKVLFSCFQGEKKILFLHCSFITKK